MVISLVNYIVCLLVNLLTENENAVGSHVTTTGIIGVASVQSTTISRHGRYHDSELGVPWSTSDNGYAPCPIGERQGGVMYPLGGDFGDSDIATREAELRTKRNAMSYGC